MRKRRRPPRERPPKEKGAVVKQGRHLIRAALVYPNTYRAGMSSLGFQTVYRLANREPKVACERVFLPPAGNGTGVARSIETGLRLDQFDLILFSISFENDFIHLVRLLRETGIPLRSSDRNHIHPLVAAGGVACFLNPEPIAPFIDVFLLGEAEVILAPFWELYRLHGDRKCLLAGIEKKIPGAYVPALHDGIYHRDAHAPQKPTKTIPVQYQASLEKSVTHTAILTSDTAFKDTFLLETLKGCPHGCRFCTAGFIYRPPRIYPLSNLLAAMDKASKITDKIGLVSSAVLDHPDIKDICRYGREKGLFLSFSSLRADRLDDEIMDVLAESQVRTATIAPEAGSGRMRRIINKKLDSATILRAVENLVARNILNLRLYFMIGLPFETDEDVTAIVTLTKAVKERFLEASRKNRKIGTITLSINPFIPKPCTPFQWAAMAEESVLKHRAGMIRQGLRKTANVTVNIESLRRSRINALLSLGDRRTADVLEAAAQKGWSRAWKENQAFCRAVVHGEKTVPDKDQPGSALPWDFLAHPVSDRFLVKEWHRAAALRQSPSCPMKDCRDCGICRRVTTK